MAVNLVVVDGIAQHVALRYDANSKPELRWTLVQQDKDWPLYLPCCAVGAAAERLAGEIENGQHVVVTSGKLCYRKRTTKAGEQSRIEVLVWQVDTLHDDSAAGGSVSQEGAGEIVAPEGAGDVGPAKKGRARYPKHLKQPWIDSRLEGRANEN